MTVICEKGNILNTKCNIICQQVNCKGVMGAGLALQIRRKWTIVYKDYKQYCNSANKYNNLLGNVLFTKVENDKYVANMFRQLNYGRAKQQTNYSALSKSFTTVCNFAKVNGYTVAIPYGIGCGLAGGSWDVVSKIILDIFEHTSVQCEIWIFRD